MGQWGSGEMEKWEGGGVQRCGGVEGRRFGDLTVWRWRGREVVWFRSSRRLLYGGIGGGEEGGVEMHS